MAIGRKVGNAVIRNRIRRTIRAACRELAPRVSQWIQVVWLPRRSLGVVRNPNLKEELEAFFNGEGLLKC